MKRNLSVKEIIYHSIEIDTESYLDRANDPFELALLINRIKESPKHFLQEHTGKYFDIVRQDSNEFDGLEINEIKE